MRVIRLNTSSPTFKDFKVSFPVYRKHDVSEYGYHVIFTRWDEDGTEWKITKAERGCDLEYVIEKSSCLYHNPTENVDYVLGRGQYECSADEFNEVLEEATEFLATFPRAKLEK